MIPSVLPAGGALMPRCRVSVSSRSGTGAPGHGAGGGPQRCAGQVRQQRVKVRGQHAGVVAAVAGDGRVQDGQPGAVLTFAFELAGDLPGDGGAERPAGQRVRATGLDLPDAAQVHGGQLGETACGVCLVMAQAVAGLLRGQQPRKFGVAVQAAAGRVDEEARRSFGLHGRVGCPGAPGPCSR